MRPVYTLCIGGEELRSAVGVMLDARQWNGDPVQRFLAFSDADTTANSVLEELQSARAWANERDRALFVLAYQGEGKEVVVNEKLHHQAWAFGGERGEITDTLLVDTLAGFGAGTLVAIVNDSCYAEGMATPGPKANELVAMQRVLEGLSRTFIDAFANKSGEKPGVVMLASAKVAAATNPKSEFAAKVLTAARDQSLTYERLITMGGTNQSILSATPESLRAALAFSPA